MLKGQTMSDNTDDMNDFVLLAIARDEAVSRVKELEAKLAKAVEALGTALSEMVDYADTHPAYSEIWEAREAARTALATYEATKEQSK